MEKPLRFWRRRWFIFSASGLGIALILGGFYLFSVKRYPVQKVTDTIREVAGNPGDSEAVAAGRKLSNGRCEGTGPSKLTKAPMRPEDFSIIIPYGLMVGNHVTPIDHQYFGPKDYNSPRDAYPVYAMGDARITEIQPRTTERGTEYRMEFTVTCTFFYYYDLVTSLTGEVKGAYEKAKDGQGFARMDHPVKAGEQIGAIGGQTLDFAVWDTEKPLKGFVTPKLYNAEPWKIYTADPLDYYTDDLKALALSRYPRTAEPLSGKIDYDVDGKLIGNWFQEGTGGYSGSPNKEYYDGSGAYWQGHLSFAPNHWDPSQFIISIGSLVGRDGRGTNQFVARGNTPDPAGVTPASGLVKYQLLSFGYAKPDGSSWNGNEMIKSPKILPSQEARGCALVQMEAERRIKFEYSAGKACAQVGGFTAAAKLYER